MTKAAIWIPPFRCNPDPISQLAYEQQQARISRSTG